MTDPEPHVVTAACTAAHLPLMVRKPALSDPLPTSRGDLFGRPVDRVVFTLTSNDAQCLRWLARQRSSAGSDFLAVAFNRFAKFLFLIERQGSAVHVVHGLRIDPYMTGGSLSPNAALDFKKSAFSACRVRWDPHDGVEALAYALMERFRAHVLPKNGIPYSLDADLDDEPVIAFSHGLTEERFEACLRAIVLRFGTPEETQIEYRAAMDERERACALTSCLDEKISQACDLFVRHFNPTGSRVEIRDARVQPLRNMVYRFVSVDEDTSAIEKARDLAILEEVLSGDAFADDPDLLAFVRARLDAPARRTL